MKLLYLLKRDTHRTVKKIKLLDRYQWTLALSIVLYILYFTAASFLRFDNFYTGRLDLGNMVQTVWNTMHGRFFVMTDPDSIGTISRMSYHADFFLVFLTPFYMIWPNPKVLLLVQTVVLALGALFVYKLGVALLRKKSVSLAIALSYLLNPSLQRSNLYDFHAVVLATTFLLGAFYFMQRRRYGLFLVFAFLAGSTKEQVWAIVGLFGLFILARALYTLRTAKDAFHAYKRKEALFGVGVAVVSFSIFYLFFSVVIPAFQGGQHFATAYFTHFGDTPTTIIKGVLQSPEKVVETLSESSRQVYLKQLLLPLGFLSIFSPLFLVFAMPDLLINLLSSNANFQQIYYQYTATITPFLFVAAIYGVRMLRHFVSRLSFRVITVYILIAAFYGSYLYGPLPYSREKNVDMFTKPRVNKETMEAYINTLPQNAIISSSNQLGSHLSEREFIYTIPQGTSFATYKLFLLSDQTMAPSTRQNRDYTDRMRNDPNYILLFQDGDFLVFKKNKLNYLLN